MEKARLRRSDAFAGHVLVLVEEGKGQPLDGFAAALLVELAAGICRTAYVKTVGRGLGSVKSDGEDFALFRGIAAGPQTVPDPEARGGRT
jgi:hypothetical protein